MLTGGGSFVILSETVKFRFGTDMHRLALISGLVSITILIDQLTKQWAMRTLLGSPSRIYFGDLFRFQYAENNGAFLSLGSGMSDGMRFWVFTVLVTLFLLGLGYYLVTRKDINIWEVVAYALVLGGGIGNLIDRWMRDGHVVDFMNMGIGSLRTGIFNVADAVIMAGMFILIGRAIFWPAKKPEHHQENPSPSPP